MLWDNNSIVIYANFPFHTEDWSPQSVQRGIGGSEEAVIYLSEALTEIGYTVTVFNRCGDEVGDYNGVSYRPVEQFNPQDKFNIVIFHRAWTQPMKMALQAKKIGIWMHDNPQLFPPIDKADRASFLSSFDKLFVLSQFHASTLPEWIPKEKIFLTRNGINLPDFEQKNLPRNSKRLIYISDYIRGIEHLLKQWQLVLEAVPEAELHLFYGWQLIDALAESPLADKFPHLKTKKQELLPLMQQPNIYEHGRIGHKQLVDELYKSGIFVYPCSFAEVFCISAIKAQACGCASIVTDYAALRETVKTGIKISGCAGKESTDRAFVEALISLLKNADQQASIRKEALALKESFGWNEVAKQWHKEFLSCDKNND